MAGFDDEIFGAPPAKPPVHAIGQPIDDLSAPELAERIALLKIEIERLERAIAQRERDAQRRGRFLQILSAGRPAAGRPVAAATLTSC